MKQINNFKKSNEKKENVQNKIESRELIKDNLDEKAKMKIWIRTLLYSYRNFPKIIQTIDKIIMSRASNYSFSTSIFNYSQKPESQYDVIIDMTERKQKLLNICIMTKTLLDSLSEDNYKLAYKKFYELCTNDEIANEYGVSTRTIFRKINDLIEKLYYFTVKNNWTLKFIELQVNEESWLIDKYNSAINEYIIDCYK